MSIAIPIEDHPDWTVGDVVTANGSSGLVHGIWQDEAGQILLTLEGVSHHPDDGMHRASEVTKGGDLELHPPTLEAVTLHPKVYRILNLKERDGCVPPGWAVLHLHDSVYVAWGLPSRRRAEDVALGHQIGVRFIASKF